jgi:hypothetical protein
LTEVSNSGCKPVGQQSFIDYASLMGANPELGDRVPLCIMRENEIDAVVPAILSAVRAFVAGG